MDLKNNYLLKKLLKGWILIFTMLYLKKRKKNTWRYYYFTLRTKNPDDMIYSSWDNRVWQTEIGNYGSFFTLLPPPLLKTQQIRNLKKWRKKNCWRYHHFTYVYQKHNHMRYGSWNTEWDRQNILSSLVIFYPLLPAKSKFWKNEKSNCICYHFTHVYHKSWSYDICFLRYKARQDFLSFWAIFCPLTLLTTWKIKILKKWHKHAWRYYHCTHVYHKWQSH